MTDLAWLPNLFIAGVPKAGTSSLHRWLADHPDALGARDKEACFFVDPESHIFRPDANWQAGLAGYRAQFDMPEGAPPKVIIDSTPAYIYQRSALAAIPDLPSRPRCLFVLREPADQIRSVYRYYRDNWQVIPAEMSFADYLVALRRGQGDFAGNELVRDALANARYLPWVRAWRERLGRERMLVCTFDELKSDPAGLTRRVAAWAGLDAGFYDAYRFEVENETYAPRSRGLHRLNAALRGRLPNGAAYRAMRALYRRLNATRPEAGEGEAAALAALRDDFAQANDELARDFGLDLSAWAGAADQSVSTAS